MNWQSFWNNIEKLHNVQAIGESMGKLFEHLSNGAEKIKLIRPEEDQKFLDAAKAVIARVQLSMNAELPLFVAYLIEAGKTLISLSGVKRLTRWSDETIIDGVKNIAILLDKMTEANVTDYELRVAQVLEVLEAVLEDSKDPNTGIIKYDRIDSIIDTATPDRLHDTVRDTFNWFGYYVPLMFDKVADTLIPQLKKLQPKIQAWAAAQRAQRTTRLAARKNFWRRNWLLLTVAGIIFLITILLMLKF